MIKNRYIWGFAVTGLAILVSLPLFSPHIIIGHDIFFHLARIEGIKEGLLGGELPARIYGFFFYDYGYPSGFFYPDVFLYFPAILRLIGFSELVSYHIFCLAINLVTALITWWSFTKFFEFLLLAHTESSHNQSYVYGAIASMLYTGFLYRLVDMYSRCAVGEAMAMAFLPLALISFWLMFHHSQKYWIGVVVGCTGVLQSHILSGLLMIVVMCLLALVSIHCFVRRDVAVALGKAILFTILLNMWFYMPFYSFYQQYDFHMKHEFSGVQVLAKNAWSWNSIADISGFVGFPILLLLVTFLLYRFWQWKRGITNNQKSVREMIVFYVMLVIGATCLWAMSVGFPWGIMEHVPLLGENAGVLQFPFRLMIFGTFALSLCLTIALVKLVKGIRFRQLVLILYCFFVAGYNLSFLNTEDMNLRDRPEPWRIFHENDRISFPETNPDDHSVHWSDFHLIGNRAVTSLYLDYLHMDISYEDVYNIPCDAGDIRFWKAVSTQEINILDPNDIQPVDCVKTVSRKGTTISFVSETNIPTNIRLPLFYYPGYEARTAEGKLLPVSSVDKHRLQVTVPTGTHEITVRYVGNVAYKNALFISLCGVFFFLVCVKKELRCN